MDFVKEAEKNCVRIAKHMSDVLEVVKALENFGNRAFNEFDREEYFDGISKIRRAVYSKFVRSISDCFLFIGVGGEDALEYSREEFKKHFGEEDRYSIMQFLEQYGHVLHSYPVADDEEFRKQAKERLEGL